MKNQMILDTDAGSDVDDLYALLLAISHPGLEVLGVTTVMGDTQARARLIAKMLRIAGRGEIPVYAGQGHSEQEAAAGQAYSHRDTHCHFVESSDPEAGKIYPCAVEFMLHTLTHATQPVTLVGIGCLTNISAVLRSANPQQRSMIGSLALMGGEILWQNAESNIKNDAEAAAFVFNSGVPTFLATWSVSRQVCFSMAEMDTFFATTDRPALKALEACTRIWWGEGSRIKTGPVCYDLIPVFWAAGERAGIECLKINGLKVELEGTYTRGMTLIHPWRRLASEASNELSPGSITVTESLPADLLKQRFFELILK